MTKLIAFVGAVVVVGVAFFSWSTSHANRPVTAAVNTFSVEEIQRGVDTKGLPETELHDMTFVFPEN